MAAASTNAAPLKKKRVVLIGTTGVGKSTFGNALLGKSTNVKSADGFEMSCNVHTCTTEASKLDGHWMGDMNKPVIRVIDTPGHGDSQGRDASFREGLVEFLKQEQYVHAFIWLLNSETPRFDMQDEECFKTFVKMFQMEFMDHLVIVLTRFSFSDHAERIRGASGKSLDGIIEDLQGILNLFGKGVPIYAIDTFHDESSQKELDEYIRQMGLLWSSIQQFGKQPLQHIKVVEDELVKVTNSLNSVTEQLKESQRMNDELEQKMRMGQQVMQESLEREQRATANQRNVLEKSLETMRQQQKAFEERLRKAEEEKGQTDDMLRRVRVEYQQALWAEQRKSEKKVKSVKREVKYLKEDMEDEREARERMSQQLMTAEEARKKAEEGRRRAEEEREKDGDGNCILM